jgi:cell volume regulation protein A
VSPWRLLGEVPLQLAIGAVAGVALGRAGRLLLRVSRLPAGGLYPVLTLAFALLAFSVPTLLHGSGFLAVYLAGMVMGNGEVPYRSGVLRFHDAFAWLGQVTMFLVLGLLVFPSRLLEAAPVGLALGLLLAVVARPLAVFACLLPFRFPRRETVLIAWVGLRGAVPIILATFPVLEGVRGAERLFDLVFFVVVVSAIIPGGTVGWATRRLGLLSQGPAPPPAVLEMSTTRRLDGEIGVYYLEPATPVVGVGLADVPIPPGATLMLLVRGNELIPPRGETLLSAGDYVYVFCRKEDRPLVDLLFGEPEE